MSNEIVIAENQGIVRMSVSVDEFKQALQEYNHLKESIATPDDKMQIEGKTFLKKSYWRKVNNAFNLSVIVVTENRTELATGDIVWDFTCEAQAKNGRRACGTGSCSIFEKAVLIDGFFMIPKKVWSEKYHKKIVIKDTEGKIVYESATPNTWHNARSTAETRAYNRAVSNLVGGGEVSAEEVNVEHIDYHNEHTGKPDTQIPQKIEAVDTRYLQQNTKEELPQIAQAEKVFNAEAKTIPLATEKQIDLIVKLLGDHDDKINDALLKYKVNIFDDLTKFQAMELVKNLLLQKDKKQDETN